MFLLYNLVLLLTSPLWAAAAWIRARRRREQPDWRERFGNYLHVQIPKDQASIWVHAVSVGEVLAVLPILRHVRAQRPDVFVVLSVTTSSGHRTAAEHGVDCYDALVYFPLDVARFQLSAMMRIKPTVVAIMETELWFNFLWAADAIGAKKLLLNGRLSDRSFPRARSFRFFYAPLLRFFDQVLVQTERDAERFRALGAKPVQVYGNCKFDEAVDGLDADPEWWRAQLGVGDQRPVVVIGSSRGEEEERFLFDSLAQVGRDFDLVWAPRHLERAEPLAKELGPAFGGVARRSRVERGPVVLLDTYGELGKVYAAADVVIIGGGFSNLGGQNLLQPLAHGKPVLHGPHMQNFRDVARLAGEAGATSVCATPAELARALRDLLDDPSRREAMGHAGREFVQSHAGASRRYADAIIRGLE